MNPKPDDLFMIYFYVAIFSLSRNKQNSLNYLTHKINPFHTDQCRYCKEEEETMIHLINECPVFNTKRQEIFRGIEITNTTDWKPRAILKFVKETSIIEALLVNTGAY